jgi:iron complex outermembrane recepter protein
VYGAQYSILLGKNERTRLSVGAINILDEEPPPPQFTGYLPTIHDALGRQIYLRLSLGL